jgi:hypothetical protein
MDKCRNCKYWVPIPPWQGNCKLYPTSKPQWSEDATPQGRGCHRFTPTAVPGIYQNGKLIKAL